MTFKNVNGSRRGRWALHESADERRSGPRGENPYSTLRKFPIPFRKFQNGGII